MSSSSCNQLMQTAIQTSQDAKEHCDRSFRHCCPHFQACGAYSFLLLSLPSTCFILQDNHCVLPWWRCSSLCGQDRAQRESGDSRVCNSELGPGCRACNTPVASFLLLRACRTSLDKPGFSGPVQCLFQYPGEI